MTQLVTSVSIRDSSRSAAYVVKQVNSVIMHVRSAIKNALSEVKERKLEIMNMNQVLANNR